MAAGHQGKLVFDPTRDAEADETSPVSGQPDLSGGGLITDPGTYYSHSSETAAGGWNMVSDQFLFEGALVGTLTVEFSNANDLDVQKGVDQWNDYETASLPAPTLTIPGVGAAARAIDVDTLDFMEIASGSALTARVATVAALPACTAAGSGVGKTLTANAVGVLTVDGVALVLNDLILVKDQANPIDNGFYKVTTEGTAGVAFVLTRSTSMDATGAETTPGVTIAVTAGTVNTGLHFVLTGTQEVAIALIDYPHGRVRYRLDITDGIGTVKDRRVLKA